MSSRINRLVFEIETAKQRLQYSIASGRDTLAFETQRQLANLNAMLLSEMKEVTFDTGPRQDYWLVFSESFQDGRVCTRTEYRALFRSMDAFDRDTHCAIPIEGPVELVEQAIALESTDRRVKRTG